MLKLETERLTLRPPCMEDFEGVHAYSSVPENVRFMVWGPNTEEDTRNFLREAEEKWKADPIMEYEFAISLKGGHVIGGCGIYLNKERNTGMLGWILHRDFWHCGYMTEAANAMMKCGFETLGLHRIYATCNADNTASYRVMERLGMRREAHFIKNCFGRVDSEKVWHDEFYYGILDEEWKTKK
ncbi:MAG TPA: GNAT family N-acetyltransferase [Oscillospiraceae bacterium]|nr:GNAT family N-acetyltransferase [Oscillospiraceae bacterium]HPF56153.1 GNAT family N-acetyltransferase [Clostridiales bacterium]HPK35582.1 GNAT family N-acetyltransferase [Oscillospiraceae bacterium]HPR75881.1 GNAT family N-acetyltransferase [Oscillospiraceae bacterium]